MDCGLEELQLCRDAVEQLAVGPETDSQLLLLRTLWCKHSIEIIKRQQHRMTVKHVAIGADAVKLIDV